MVFNLKISSWLESALGGLASWVVVAAIVLLALNVFFRLRLLQHRAEGAYWLLDRTLAIRFLCLLFFVWVLVGFYSKAPGPVFDVGHGGDRWEAATSAVEHLRQVHGTQAVALEES